MQLPKLKWASPGAPLPPPLGTMPCPNCAADEQKSSIVTIEVQLPDRPARRLHLLHCSGCRCHFFDDQASPDYSAASTNDRGRVPFYVQQGAGISLITRPLAQLRREAPCAYLEVGCGFGFGLDYALNTRGWSGIGVDPAPLAALGRDALGLPIELRYLQENKEAPQSKDVVMGSEVIEHVSSPRAFARTLRAMLKPSGVLVLTTPNGDDIRPDTPPGIIIPLLSPGMHLVIQSPQSLRRLLEAVGFAHVAVSVDGHSLVAFASDAPLALDQDMARLRTALRQHLQRRASASHGLGDPFLGFAGRAFQESVNDGDMEAANQAWELLLPACKERFGLDLDEMEALPEAVATSDLEQLGRLIPLNLAGLLYARAICQIALGFPRPPLERRFLLAARAAAAMRRALGELAMEDGQTEDIGWTAEAEALLCAADAGDPETPFRLAGLRPAPTDGDARRAAVVQRALTALVNAGHYHLAGDLVRETNLHRAAFAAPVVVGRTDAERDALYCLGVLALNVADLRDSMGGLELARDRLSRVRDHTPTGSGLWDAAVRGELAALQAMDDADAIAALAGSLEGLKSEIAALFLGPLVNAGCYTAAERLTAAFGLDSTADRDQLYLLAKLDLHVEGRAAVAQERFAQVQAMASSGSGLWWSALRGELHALDQMGKGRRARAVLKARCRGLPSHELPADLAKRLRGRARTLIRRALLPAYRIARYRILPGFWG